MKKWGGRIFKIIIISMMLMMFLSTWLYSLMYIWWNKTQENIDEDTLTWELFSWSQEVTGDILNTWNLELTGN